MKLSRPPTHGPRSSRPIRRFAELVLGKGTVIAKDSPNFIANRIGTFLTLNVIRIMQEGGYTIEEIDTLTGPAMGLPKSATFRTLDLVGLDVLLHVIRICGNHFPKMNVASCLNRLHFCCG